MNRKNILIISTLLILVVGLFITLVKVNPRLVANIPIIGNIAKIINPSSSVNAASNTNSRTSGSSFTVGDNKGSDSITPLSGAQLSPAGAYNDGIYTGFSTSESGVLIIKITVTKGVLSDISFLTLPKDVPQTVLSQLAQEAIQNQVVEVSPVNGYDSISRVFNLALSNAVSKAFKV